MNSGAGTLPALQPAQVSTAGLAAATAELDALGAPFGYAVSPALLPLGAYTRMSSAWRAMDAGVRAFIQAHDGELASMAADLGLPDLLPLATTLPDTGWALFGRPDMVMSAGQPKIVDVNMHGLAGLFPMNDMLLRTHRAPELRERFRQPGYTPRFLMGHYADILRRFMTSDEDMVALTIYAAEAADPHYGKWHYDCQIRELALRGVTTRITFAEELDITPRGVFAEGRRVGLIHRFFLPLPGPDQPHEMAELVRIAAAARAGIVPVLTGSQEELLATKATLALLSDERFTDKLAPSLAGQLSQAIPWTRLLEERHTRWRDTRIDLLPWAAAHRADLVVKPARGYAGTDVTIGRELSAAQWAALIQRAVADEQPWVVQEILKPDEEAVCFRDMAGEFWQGRLPTVYGTYILDGEFVGAIRRYGIRGSDYAMINGTVGAVPSPVYWK